MTTPVLERINTYAPMTFDEDESGFPFDRDLDRGRRDESFRTQLDDIAKRHPEFAEHLEGFPFRSDSLGSRPRRQFAERPFGSGSRFERFDFPFDRDPFEQEQQSQAQQEEPPQQPQEPQPEPEKQERGRNKNIKQSNTADLGQKQEEVNDQRNQRSMSAPPPDNRSSPRFVSSINIPINPEGGMGDAPQPQPQPQQSSKPTERIIPIHIEGRDEPFFPKHSGPSFAPQPQPERVFGQRPSQFTQFQRESPRNFGAPPDWQYAKPKEVPVQKPEPPQKPPQQKVEPEPEPQPEPEPPKSSSNPIDMIQSIQKDVSALMGQVENFTGASKDKQYIYLDEMLTRNLLKLDDVDTQGQENIRLARREAIKCIQKCINILEAKATANVPKEEKMEVEPSNDSQSKPEEQMEVEAKEPVEEEEKAEAIPLKAEAIPLPSPQAKETENVEQKSEEEKPQESTEPEQNEEKTDDKKDKKKGKKKVAKK